jgi:hypothetical protein
LALTSEISEAEVLATPKLLRSASAPWICDEVAETRQQAENSFFVPKLKRSRLFEEG